MAYQYDAVIIGAGLGGLSAAAHLAKAGRRVLVVEQNSKVGGYASFFKRGDYRFEVSLRALDGAAPGGRIYEALKDLDVLEQLRFQRLDPFYQAHFPRHEITAWADSLAYETELIRHFPGETKGIRNLIDAMQVVYKETRRYMYDSELRNRPPVELLPTYYPVMLSALNMSWSAFMAQYISEARLKGIFSMLGGHFGLLPDGLNAAAFILPWVSHHIYGAYYPQGGSQAVSQVLEKVIKDNGGDVLLGQRVVRIVVNNGSPPLVRRVMLGILDTAVSLITSDQEKGFISSRKRQKAVAVETDDGTSVEAKVVISNANAPDTLLRLIGDERLTQDHSKKAAALKPSMSTMAVYMGLNKDLSAGGWQHHETLVSRTYDMAVDRRAVPDGDFNKSMFSITNLTTVDPSCAPEGKSALMLLAPASWDYDNQWRTRGELEGYSQNPDYILCKEGAAAKLIKRAEKYTGGLRAAEVIDIATPLTNWRYTLNPGGAIYGSRKMADNVHSKQLSETTSLPNLFLAGAWASGGGMSQAMLSGRSVARRALAYLERRGSPLWEGVDLPGIESEIGVGEQAGGSAVGDAAGETAPAITLTAAVSHKQITLDAIGRPALLICHDRSTAKRAKALYAGMREEYPEPAVLFIANVIDLRNIPRLLHKLAEKEMTREYEAATAIIPDASRAAEMLVILPDWKGEVTESFGLRNLEEQLVVLALKPNGHVAEIYQGEAPEEAARKMAGELAGQ